MNKEDLKKLGLTDEAQMDQIIVLHGKDIEKHKTAAETVKTEADTVKAQLAEANKQIDGFKALKVEDIQKAADDYKAKYEQAQKDASAQVSALKYDTALKDALKEAKAKNPIAVQALLSKDALKYNETDGSIVGLKEQLEKIKSENDYLFEAEGTTPKIVAGGQNQSVIGDKVVEAARKSAGLVTGEK